MKLRDIIKGVAGVAGAFNPAIGAAIGVVNTFLPDDEKLPGDATPEQIQEKIKGLDPEVQKKLLETEVAVPLAEIDSEIRRYELMTKADDHQSRAWIAKVMCVIMAFEIVCFTVLTGYAIATETDISAWWPVFLTLTSVPAELLRYYFGVLRKEQHARRNYMPKGFFDMFKRS